MENESEKTIVNAGSANEFPLPNAKSLFEYQFDLLKSELDLINASIRQMDDIGKNIKNWAILVWIASVGWFISTPVLRNYFWITSLLPFLFWIVDASFRTIQRTFIVRMDEISDFLNDSKFTESYERGYFVDFRILCMRKGWPKMTLYMSVRRSLRIMFFITVAGLYIGLSFLSAMWYFITFMF
jgi:hypothetical protein